MNRRTLSKLLGSAATLAAMQPALASQADGAVRDRPRHRHPRLSACWSSLGMTILDLIGPQQFFAVAPGRTTQLLWKTRDPVVSDSGVPILPTATFDEAPEELEILFVPGGFQGTGADDRGSGRPRLRGQPRRAREVRHLRLHRRPDPRRRRLVAGVPGHHPLGLSRFAAPRRRGTRGGASRRRPQPHHRRRGDLRHRLRAHPARPAGGRGLRPGLAAWDRVRPSPAVRFGNAGQGRPVHRGGGAASVLEPRVEAVRRALLESASHQGGG